MKFLAAGPSLLCRHRLGVHSGVRAEEEVRETYDVQSVRGIFPDGEAPIFQRSVAAFVPGLCRLTRRLFRCLSLAIGR